MEHPHINGLRREVGEHACERVSDHELIDAFEQIESAAYAERIRKPMIDTHDQEKEHIHPETDPNHQLRFFASEQLADEVSGQKRHRIGDNSSRNDHRIQATIPHDFRNEWQEPIRQVELEQRHEFGGADDVAHHQRRDENRGQ